MAPAVPIGTGNLGPKILVFWPKNATETRGERGFQKIGLLGVNS